MRAPQDEGFCSPPRAMSQLSQHALRLPDRGHGLAVWGGQQDGGTEKVRQLRWAQTKGAEPWGQPGSPTCIRLRCGHHGLSNPT